MNAKVLAFCNHKGGVGKTTSVISVASLLANKGNKVLMVDLDAQCNLTSSLIDGEPDKNIYTALKERKNLPMIELSPNLFLSPASLDLAAIETEIGGQIGRERALERLIKPIRGSFDYILIDCPPSLGLLLLNALTASDKVYIPLTAETLPYRGLKSLENVIAQVKEYLNSNLKIGGIFFTRWNGRKLNKGVEDAARANYGGLIFDTKIRENITIAEAPTCKQSIFDYAPESNGAQDYEELTLELLQREKG